MQFKDIDEDYGDWVKEKAAKAVSQEYPEYAIKIYLKLVKESISKSARETYRIAAGYAKKLKDIYAGSGQKSRWENYVSRIREENKRRPALIDEFRKL